ncbi:MAG: hypothetical protein QN120_04020 [Armatimonadota bacterium]|nr:hypothetical protein [Armatimonadota bacterium]
MRKGLAVVVSILAAHALAATQVKDGNLIVPGDRIGPYRLGVTGAALREQLGLPQNLGAGANPTLAATGWTFGPQGQRWALLALVRRDTDQVVALLLQGAGEATRFRTAEGVALGTPVQTAWQVYGTPSFRWLLSDRTGFIVAVYDRIGLAIGGYTQAGVPLPVPANTVYYLRVFPAGSADGLWPASQIPRMP